MRVIIPTSRRHHLGWLAALLVAVLTSACANAAAGQAIAPTDRLYVSIGDSYAAGYQPDAGTTTNGFAYQVADRAGLRLVNYGCSGITSTALLRDRGCAQGALAPGAPDYAGTTQAGAALAFLRSHHAQVSLVTVVIGGNDVEPCLFTADGARRADETACTTAAVATLRANLATLLADVRAAVGPGVRVVGLTYPDVYLGAWVRGAPTEATDSVGLFRDVFNPALRDSYAAVGATFVDVTAATGGYDPLTDTVADPTYGTVPRPVARVCALTFWCTRGDPHPTTEGHAAIAAEVLAAAGES